MAQWTTDGLVDTCLCHIGRSLSYGCFFSAVGHLAVIGPLRFVSLVVAFIISLQFFGDDFKWMGLIGALLIVGSALWIVYRQVQTGQTDS